MKKKDKKNSIDYWNRHATQWENMAYNKEKTYMSFPSSEQRENITVHEIEKITKNKNVSIVDLGCANGELVRHLLRNGFTNVRGIDNSEQMIATAKQLLKKAMPTASADAVFSVEDVDSLKGDEVFDIITGMGIVEYLLDADAFFSRLGERVTKGGYAFIESRNKLFNLFSANQYTVQSDITALVKARDTVARLSPIQDSKEIEQLVRNTYRTIGEHLQIINPQKTLAKKEFEKYPFTLPQYTPQEIEVLCKRNRLTLKYIIYYHPHPFPPSFISSFPHVFNRIAYDMEPLGYTPIGATICSSFIAVIQK
ncbi:MAG: class I SAM-dependent methyltransferase [bacterium]|nr:class I SAM-dependent methyltransferase [bacterium]